MGDDKKELVGLGILDVQEALENTFKGCDVKTSGGIGSFHASVEFDEYRIRVILSGRRSEERNIHFRFMQESKGRGRHATKRMINEVKTTKPEDLVRAVADAKSHLLGVAHAIQAAFKPKPVDRVKTIDDLMRD